MALAYTVNWIEQGRNPVETGDSGTYEVIDVAYRLAEDGGKFYRQSRSRRGTVSWSSSVTYCDVTYRAVTVSESGATTQITASQAAAIQVDAYQQGCKSCTTAREDGPNFSVTKVERETTPLVSTGAKSTTWEDWSDWTPPLPSESASAEV